MLTFPGQERKENYVKIHRRVRLQIEGECHQSVLFLSVTVRFLVVELVLMRSYVSYCSVRSPSGVNKLCNLHSMIEWIVLVATKG